MEGMGEKHYIIIAMEEDSLKVKKEETSHKGSGVADRATREKWIGKGVGKFDQTFPPTHTP